MKSSLFSARLLFFLCIALSLNALTFLTSNAQTTCPPNIDFEDGNFDNWEFFTGMCCPLDITTPSVPIAGRMDIMSGAGVDPYGLFPVVPPGAGNYTLKLGNDNSGSRAEKAVYTFTVPTDLNNFSLIYRYAVVFEDPNHPVEEQPLFEVKISKAGTNEVLPCAHYTYIATASLPGFQTSALDPQVLFKDWAVASIDLSDYAGETLTAEFSTSDCGYGAHFGYAYVDLTCGSFEVAPILCEGATSITLNGPEGFASYEWYNLDYSSLIHTGKDYTITNPTGGIDLNLVIQPFLGFGCPDTIKSSFKISDLALGLEDQIEICNKNPFALFARASSNVEGITYKWEPNIDISCTDCPFPYITPNASQTYTVTVTDAGGCSLSKSVQTNPTPKVCCDDVFIPNAFTPNGDGLNDLFKVNTEIDLELENWSVFNRWGQQLWSATDHLSGWDGTFNKEKQNVGTYFYIFNYKCKYTQQSYQRRGDITLIR